MKKFLSLIVAIIIFCSGSTIVLADPGDENRSNNAGDGGTHGEAIGEPDDPENNQEQERNNND